MTSDETLQSDHPPPLAHPCPHCHSTQIVEHTAKLLNLKVQLCNQCGLKFKHNKDGTIHSWSFNAIINDRTYKLVFLTELQGKPEFSVWHITSGSELLGQEIITFKFLPDITPANVHKKLPIYLLFL